MVGSPSEPRTGDLVRDRVLRIETPEHVAVEFPLAGPGSRFGALALDVVVLLLAAIGAGLALGVLARGGLVTTDFATGLIILALVALLWGYFFAFELFRDGQTLGKRAFGIRVVLEGGHPLTAQAAAVRNLLRFLDVQPLPSCLIGGAAILLDGKGRRLGDLAAGTVVVRDLPIDFPEPVEVGLSSEPPRLGEPAFAALEGFVERAPALPEAARERLAQRLLASLERFGSPQAWTGEAVDDLIRFHAGERRRRAAARLSTAAGAPAAAALLRVKRERWENLRESVARLRKLRLSRVSEDEVATFAARYRALSADLARARTYGASARTVFALEHLVGAAHNLFYRPVGRGLARLGSFLIAGFPRLVRELWRPLALSGVLLLAPVGVGYTLVVGDPDHERLLADAGIIERAEKAAADPNIDYRDTWEGAWMGFDALAALLVANNVQVAFYAFIGGLLAGLGSVALLVLNGMHFGVALAVFANRGVLGNIGLFVIGHGAIELTAIAIAGGAGLWMGSAVWFPGRAPRATALVSRAREAVQLMGGVVALLVVAGLIEGFLSPARLPAPAKIAIALGALGWLVTYLGLAGRRRTEQPAEGGTGVEPPLTGGRAV